MSSTGRLAVYGWLAVYYDQIAPRPGFAAMGVPDQWSALRAEMLAAHPPNDLVRRQAIDAIDESRHRAILASFAHIE